MQIWGEAWWSPSLPAGIVTDERIILFFIIIVLRIGIDKLFSSFLSGFLQSLLSDQSLGVTPCLGEGV